MKKLTLVEVDIKDIMKSYIVGADLSNYEDYLDGEFYIGRNRVLEKLEINTDIKIMDLVYGTLYKIDEKER